MPVLVERPQNLSLKQGDTAWFTCKTYDSHHTYVDWYYLNDVNPQDIDTNDLQQFKKMVNDSAVSFSLIFKNVFIINCLVKV